MFFYSIFKGLLLIQSERTRAATSQQSGFGCHTIAIELT